MNAKQLLTHFDRLAEAPDAVPRLRRFILDLAVRGKLVEQDARDEPASELLKRIHAERFRILNKSLQSSKVLVTESASTDIQLPTGWAWSRLGSLCTKTGSGSTPSGGKDAYVSCGVPFLRSQNVYDDGLRLEGVAFISEATQTRMSSTTVKAGDLLLNITGGSIGRCAVVPESFVIGNINQHVAIIRLAFLESGRFLHSVICSDYFQKHIFGNQTGAGREGLPKNRMDEILIPLPPLAEQHRIVAKVDELMALCDQLEAAQQERERCRDRLAAASLQRLNQPAADVTLEAQREYARFHLQHLPRLVTRPEQVKAMRQLFLNLAVRGKLVEQDARDEPAVTLLRRLTSLVGKKARATTAASLREPWPLPSGWEFARFVDILTLEYGDNLPAEKRSNSGEFPVYGSNGIVGSHHEAFVQSPCIVVGRKGSAGALNLCLASGCCVTDVAYYCIPPQGVDLNFAFKMFHTLGLDALGKGIKPGLSRAEAYELAVPLPPLAEQRRIVAKVDELMAVCDQLEAQLATTQTDSRRLLEAVLEAALV